MKPAIYYYAVALFCVGLIPFVPRLISFRVAVLNAVHLNRLAAWHDRNRKTLVPVVRIILTAIAVTLIILGASS